MMQTNLEALIEAAKHLTKEERDKLVEALHPHPEASEPQHRITEMRGLGKICGRELIRRNISRRSANRGTTDAAYCW